MSSVCSQRMAMAAETSCIEEFSEWVEPPTIRFTLKPNKYKKPKMVEIRAAM
jgi:hypothetical protein